MVTLIVISMVMVIMEEITDMSILRKKSNRIITAIIGRNDIEVLYFLVYYEGCWGLEVEHNNNLEKD